MSVLGYLDIEKFLKKLDEFKLLDVCADILALDGHTDIRIVDGPGDGQRDIHSIDSDGNKYLTQSKYHGNLNQSVSAKELGEVVLGMVRFGYKRGLFITNARISPQAKRDCINDFPDYSVSFLEGKEIIKKVFDDLVLKAIWYDGQSLDKVSYTLIIPILARNLEIDKPLPMLSYHATTLRGNRLVVGRSEVQINYRRSISSPYAFGEYRSPKRKTFAESGSSQIVVTEAILSGVIHMEDIEQILEALGEEALSQVIVSNPDKKHLAVILGRPSLTPLGGEASGSRIELESHKHQTLVVNNEFKGKEIDWIIPTKASGWILPDDPRCSQSDWIRWYNPENDICLDIIVVCPPNNEFRYKIIEKCEYFIKWWKESLFMLVPNEMINRLESIDIPNPTKYYEWDNNYSLCYWLNPIFNSPIIRSSIEPEYEDAEPYPSENDLSQIKFDLGIIRRKLELLGSIFTHPEKARHMVSILEEDPFPNYENVVFQCKHIAYDLSTIPTPIEPASRWFQFTVCWDIKPRDGAEKFLQLTLDNLLKELSNPRSSTFKTNFYLDTDTLLRDTFILLEIEYSPDDKYQQTSKVLENVRLFVLDLIGDVEKILAQKVQFSRATKNYWDNELFMTFK